MMGFDLFGYIRRKAAEAVVGGVADGVQAITPEGEPVPVSLDELRAMLTQAVAPARQLAAAPTADALPEPAAGADGGRAAGAGRGRSR